MILFFGHLDTFLENVKIRDFVISVQVRLIVEAGGRGAVELADQCEKIRLDRLMPLEVLVIVIVIVAIFVFVF